MRLMNLAAAGAMLAAFAVATPKHAEAGGRHHHAAPHGHAHLPPYERHSHTHGGTVIYHHSYHHPVYPAPHHHGEVLIIRKPRKYYKRLRKLQRHYGYYHY